MIGEIIITNNLEYEVNNIKTNLSNTRIFPALQENLKKGEFKIGDARDAINESLISSNELKNIILVGEKFNIQAQNALLKVLEEPPNNTNFILVTKYKSSILPTIISRMIVKNKKTKSIVEKFQLDLNTINLSNINEFLKTLDSSLKREDLRNLISSLLFSVKEANIKLNKKELDYFSEALIQVETYEQPKYIFLQLLLMILENKRKCTKRLNQGQSI
ncbi:MAG: DNA polymerase III subunit delta' [Helicobacteraceae bacterium]|nr:DNA polymerase III subunit delta' [Helicobacteraceae bacterium]